MNTFNAFLSDPLTPMQIDELHNALRKTSDGMLRYAEFFESFKIVDAKSNR